ncbi:IPT/TIG domain-containing protein [Nonlabens xiamenensis]|uniref:IPT/TIG domain-containing protein n=1 Tax=Nonlabens xiamenensis TaxID=2341043 RepID=UPI000F60C886|nr:IPT/TIG domain-containing protein [Nonlabens xiamenensis]
MKHLYQILVVITIVTGVFVACDADTEIDQTVEEIRSKQPTITSFSPGTAAVNSTVSIEGTFLNFANQAFIGDTEATITSRITGELLEIQVPNNASSGVIKIVTEQGKEAVSSETLTVTYPVPAVTAALPASGDVNALINVTGTDLGSVTSVSFGGTEGVIEFQEDQALVVRIPNNVGFVDVEIAYLTSAGPATATIANGFEIILPQPTLEGFPAVMSRDNEVIVTGQDMNLITSGDVNGTAISINSQTPTEVRFNVPSGIATGYVDVNFDFQGGGTLSQTGIPYINGQYEQYYEFDALNESVMTLDLTKDPGATHEIVTGGNQPPFPGNSYYSLEMNTATGSTIGRTKVQDNTSNMSWMNILDSTQFNDNPVLHFWMNSEGTEPVFVLYLGGTSNPNRRRWQNSTTNTGNNWELIAVRLKNFIPNLTSIGTKFEMRLTTGSSTSTLPEHFNWDWLIVTDRVLTEFGARDVTDEFSPAG